MRKWCKMILDGPIQELVFSCAEGASENSLDRYKKGWSEIWSLCQIKQLPRYLYSLQTGCCHLEAETETGMKSLLSPTNPVRSVYIHRQPQWGEGSDWACLRWESDETKWNRPVERQLKHFFHHISSGFASPPHRSLTQKKKQHKVSAKMRAPGKMAEMSFFHTFFFLFFL